MNTLHQPHLKLFVHGKAFGKRFITYQVVDISDDDRIVLEGKCTDYTTISDIYFGLVREHGEQNVRMLSR